MAKASNSNVNRECLSVHGNVIVLTPQSGHRQRGVRAVMRVSNCIVSRCRQVRSSGAFETDSGRYDYGPVLSTAFAVLTLAIPDETIPVFQR